MDMSMKLQSLGFLASFTGSIALIPKVIETYHNKSGKHINVTWLITTLISSSLWFMYAITNTIIPTIISSTFVMLSTLLLCLMKYNHNNITVEEEIEKTEEHLKKLKLKAKYN